MGNFRYLPGLLVTSVLSCQTPPPASEQLIGGIQYIDAISGTVVGFAADYKNPVNTQIRVNVCFDSPNGNCLTVTANSSQPNPSYCAQGICHNFMAAIPDGPVGSVTPKDGGAHMVYATIVSPSRPGSADLSAIGSPFPFTWAGQGAAPMYPPPNLSQAPTKLSPSQIAVLVNAQDPYSIGTAADVCPGNVPPIGSDGVAGYYVNARGIPCSNVFVVSTQVTRDMPDRVFNSDVVPVLQSIPAAIQAIAIAWVQPSRVFPQAPGQNYSQGMTSAVAFGKLLDSTAFVTPAGICLVGAKTDPNPYFNSGSIAPYTDYAMRPSMMVAAQSCTQCDPSHPDWVPSAANAMAMIDRAVSADSTLPQGSVYVMRTTDMNRNLRSWALSPLDQQPGAISPNVQASLVLADSLSNQTDILYYAQGTANQKNNGNSWIPGGVGDSMTSTAGVLPASGNQTPITWWIDQGAVGSYGTVSEPCDLLRKFPDPAVFMRHYTSGSSLVEAYWKSVRIPFQGNFIGDPLVAPFYPVATAAPQAVPDDAQRRKNPSKKNRSRR